MKIDGYRFGEIIIDGRRYTSDVLIMPDKVLSWWRKAGHAVAVADLVEAISVQPEFLIIGTGAYGVVRVLPEVKSFLAREGVVLIAAPTAEACCRYNELAAKHRVVAGLHLTC
ncbi:Mth938-like domain-containing protein [Thermodesulfitimonas sp.]